MSRRSPWVQTQIAESRQDIESETSRRIKKVVPKVAKNWAYQISNAKFGTKVTKV